MSLQPSAAGALGAGAGGEGGGRGEGGRAGGGEWQGGGEGRGGEGEGRRSLWVSGGVMVVGGLGELKLETWTVFMQLARGKK